MDREWPFFAATLANAEMALAKSDLDIAERYAVSLRTMSFGPESGSELRTSMIGAREKILRLTGQNRLLDREPVLRRSIDRRNPYVDPISFVQVELLRRLRRGTAPDSTCARSCARSTESPVASRALAKLNSDRGIN